MWRALIALGAGGVLLAGVLGTSSSAASPGQSIGSGDRTCVPGPQANCRDVVHKWKFEHHGDLSGAKFARAHLHGANLRGVTLKGANMRGVILRRADLRDAKLRRAHFGPASLGQRVTRDIPPCSPHCQGADLSGANLAGAYLCLSTMPDGTTNNSSCP